MKLYNRQKPATLILSCCLLTSLLFIVSCRKEKAPEPSNLDKNYFVIEDNPSDPVDHSIYTFYKSTGIATFYTDSIYKKRVSREGEIPERFAYIKLTLNYTPLGNPDVYSELLSSRANIQSLLHLLETDIIPKLPSAAIIPSILLIDSFSDHTYKNVQIPHGLTSICGFNTVGITVAEVEMMNNEERKMYAASILAGIAVTKINELYAGQLQKEFFSISRAATSATLPVDIYSNYPWFLLLTPGMEPAPLDIGFLFYPTTVFLPGDYPNQPREVDDLRAFLTAAFYYTTAEFTDLHQQETLVLQKFNIIRRFVKDAGFSIPE
ncbi:hypothetical protein [Pseudobacter ginsenosidimutans]|uniref:Lipoprotein n=1 Tax=Pseudobacter ginsenosidimutans TaxID=661488 RepID=A0A4Q7N1F4_9BACT|nr:hypothetical protein [Pseudobacter ginsenosidimutans]RZS75447.1 hypothetical protein EV199_1313 [Pseudobacter ginsenosidimutans]